MYLPGFLQTMTTGLNKPKLVAVNATASQPVSKPAGQPANELAKRSTRQPATAGGSTILHALERLKIKPMWR